MAACTQCGAPVGGGRFCGNCGAPMTQAHSSIAGGPLTAPPQSGTYGGAPSSTGATAYGGPPTGGAPSSTGATAYGGPPTGGVPLGGAVAPQPFGTVTGQPAPISRSATVAPSDILRDLAALAALIWVLIAQWSPDGSGGSTIYVLLTVICSMASLVPIYLQKVMVRPDGRPTAWPTISVRVVMNLPLLIAILVSVARNIVYAASDGDSGLVALGPGVAAASFAVALAMVPRAGELRARPDAELIARRWRRVAGWTAGLGLASILATLLKSLMPFDDLGYSGGWLAVFVLVLISVVVFAAALFALPAVRVGGDHPAWQPTALWLGLAFLFLVIVVGGRHGAMFESADQPFFGWWLVLFGVATCAVPMRGGRDGSRSTAEFWALVVANAFRVVVVAGSILAAELLLVIILAQQYGDVPGTVIWSLIAAVIGVLAAAVGSAQLRADPIRGRTAAFGALAVMAIVTIIDWAIAGVQNHAMSGSVGPLGLPVLIGTYVVIIFGLTVPKPIRDAVAAHRPPSMAPQPAGYPQPSGYPAPGGYSPPIAGQQQPAGPQASTALHAPAGSQAPAGPQTFAGPQAFTGPPATAGAGDADDLERTVMRPTTHQPAARPDPGDGARAADPTTPAADLQAWAQSRPDLRPAIAANPATYPALLDWLAALGDPAVDAALARRHGTSP